MKRNLLTNLDKPGPASAKVGAGRLGWIGIILFIAFSFTSKVLYSQISISGGNTVTESFSIGTSATASLPSNWKVDKSTVVRTVGTFSAAVTATERTGATSTEFTTTAGNGIWNCGAGTNNTGSDRAIGGLSSSSASKSVNLYAYLQNSGATSINSFTISYNVEKYRNGSNAAGYSIQMYYSTDGISWTSAGINFLTSFAADADNNGFVTAPGVTVAVNAQTLPVSVAAGSNIYLAWNYSVTSGTTTSNAQALAIDDVSITAVASSCTPPTVTSSASPATICSGSSSTLTASGADTYSWNPGSLSGASVSVSPTATTTYTVTGTTSGCTATSTVTVTVNTATITASASPASICSGNSSSLTAAGGTSYVWSTTETANPITVSPAVTATYTVTGTAANTCTGTATVSVTVNSVPSAPTAGTNTPSQTQIVWDWTDVAGATGYQWNTTNTYPGAGVNTVASSTYTQTGLTCATAYTLYVWTYNSCGYSAAPVTLTQSTSACGGGSGCASDLIISEYVEGSSNNKYIEIYNGTGAAVDLSDYYLQLYSNGTSTPANSIMTGSLANGAVIVYKNSSATVYGGAATDNGACGFNGDDAVALYKISSGTYVDIIGRIGSDPGSAWTSGAFTTLDKTLVRNADVLNGVTTNPVAGFPTLATEWTQYNIDVVTNLGSHTMTCGPMITVTPSALDFGELCVNATSAEQTYTVSGTNLTGNIVITPPANFEISLTSGAGFVANPSTITLTPATGTVAATTIYVRFKPTAVQAYSGNISHTSTGALTKNVAVSGAGVNTSSITSQPSNQSVADGVNASFSVTASNVASYQWQENQTGTWNNLSNSAPYSGVTTSTLSIVPATFAMTGYQYRCIITSACSGSVTSDAGTLNVSAPSVYCLDEDFAAGSLPAGWDQTSVTFTSYYAEFASMTGQLATIAVSTPVTLTFDLARTTNATAKDLIVEVSTTTQAGVYTPVATYDHSNTTSGGTTLCTVDLSAYSALATVYIRFRKASSTTSPWRLDNIKLNCTTVPNTITTGTVSTSPFSVTCSAGANGTVTFTSTDVFIAGNTYTAQLSNASGSFASPVNIGSITSTANSGTINITIPPGTATGAGYKIRVISNAPSVMGVASAAFSVTLSGGPCSCYEIESILVDACGAGNVEGENEMFRFVVGAADILTSQIIVDWPNNSWLGICQDGNSAAVVSAINATITPPGQLVEPIGGVIPAGSQVMFFTSTDFNYGMFDFSALNYTLYAVFQCPGNTEGHFGNYTSSGDKILTFDCGACATESVTYNAGLLYHGDGATVDFDVPGNPTYSDSGECTTVPIFTLPIELLFLKATCNDNNVQLHWATATEINNAYFTIEEAEASGEFRPVAIVQGAGNSNDRIDYAWDLVSDSRYFRLKQTDYDGKYSYSDVIAVDCEDNQVQVFPTLASEGDEINIIGEVSSVRVFDSMSREINPEILDNKVCCLEPGMYFFVINQKWTYKVIVQ